VAQLASLFSIDSLDAPGPRAGWRTSSGAAGDVDGDAPSAAGRSRPGVLWPCPAGSLDLAPAAPSTCRQGRRWPHWRRPRRCVRTISCAGPPRRRERQLRYPRNDRLTGGSLSSASQDLTLATGRKTHRQGGFIH
jgi:hypothetical protein